MAPRRLAGVVALLGVTSLVGACGLPSPAVDLTWLVEPGAGAGAGTDTHVTMVMRHRADGRPASGARLTLEGHMSHPGMAPVIARVDESANGTYEARLPLTMAGTWTLVVSGTLANGRRVTWEYQVGVSGAAPAS